MKQIIKSLLFRTLHLLNPITNFFEKFVYSIRLSKWINKNPYPNSYRKYLKGKKHITRYDLYSYILKHENIDDDIIDYLEFGVYKGDSLKWWSEHLKNSNTRLFGFDTFTGLPEKFASLKKGHFSTNKSLPNINDKRIRYEIGLFQETLDIFINTIDLKRKSIINIDADLYSSTLFVLTKLIPKLKKGSILIFDEFCSNFGTHEYRAFIDFISSYYIEYQFLGSVRNYTNVAIKIL